MTEGKSASRLWRVSRIAFLIQNLILDLYASGLYTSSFIRSTRIEEFGIKKSKCTTGYSCFFYYYFRAFKTYVTILPKLVPFIIFTFSLKIRLRASCFSLGNPFIFNPIGVLCINAMASSIPPCK